MTIRKSAFKAKLLTSPQPVTSQSMFIFDEQGKEVRLTTHMIQSACHQLLSRCRKIRS